VDEAADQAVWVREQVLTVLREADPSAWRADRAEELRQRIRAIVTALQRRSAEMASGGSSPRIAERLHSVVAAMERALPAESTRSRWAAFLGTVHPEYEALLEVLPKAAAVPSFRPTNYTRSLVHFASAATGCASVALFSSRVPQLVIAGTFFTYAWSMEGARKISPAVNKRLMRFYGPIAHPHEHVRINSATWFATALLLLAAFATRPGMMAALAILGVADPIAAFAGRRWGKHPIRDGRSLEGTLAFFASGVVAAAVGLALVGTGSVGKIAALSVVAALAGALAELWTMKLDDNLTIPVVVGAVVTLGTLGSFG
jgi:dolichol kinase